MNGKEDISLYFHVPFCKRKCSYCHFYVVPENESSKDHLLQGFLLEWDLVLPLLQHKNIVSIYFGGGTPSLFGPERIGQLLRRIEQTRTLSPQAEITLEVNPENATIDWMKAYADSGINRMSLGVQTLNGELLHLLGRLHQPETAIQAVHAIHQAGIGNLSIDLMYDLPKQNLTQWIATLDAINDLPITHLSLYNLTIEPHTLFFKNQAQLRPLLPDEDTSLAMYETAIEKLEAMGCKQYEISAFAIPGYESLHNSGYWIGRPFLGFGPSAFSYWENQRFRNIAHLNKYATLLKDGILPRDFEEELTPDARRRELLTIQLRLKTGVDLDHFQQIHGPLEQDTESVIEKLLSENFLSKKNNVLILTKRGMLFYDTIASDLI
jgi:oxygen-independent coproporphyrinogen-3 oxidase